ncbi:ankyrin repeat and LEM domain-containing protein 2 isoform X2 [Brachyhypopomus gauderio]|uniref:ankyrin repeat and LEM domain-containing protein 2 isoform X2 n=1 Tax=Brachyhypopomus gauderio TaxID=698409 RepID=UPI004043777A
MQYDPNIVLSCSRMETALGRLRSLSADELREEIINANLKCGPITDSTRAVFERKLARALLEAADPGAGATPDEAPPGGSALAPDPPAGEEGDVGYDLGLNPPEEEPLMEKSGAGALSSSPVDDDTCPSDTQTPCETPQVSPTYFGVCPLWEDVLARNERIHVYTDRKEALQVVKVMKGARFKAFSSREDAEKFAKGICDYYPSPSKSAPCLSPVKAALGLHKEGCVLAEVDSISRERANSFKSPRTQDLTAKLRRAVERGDEAAFSELVWSNPRYLIGSGDNPTVVQEGCRYNVMHVAAKENQARVAQLLLDTLDNPEFMRLMYPDDQDSMLSKRIRYIVDLYLNTPDKAGFETPLHFACKFGCVDVVNVLCSHPDIVKNRKNKYDQRPVDVICERMKDKSQIQEVKQKITEYLEDRFFVPLLRAADNSAQPVIGAPWSPEPMENLSPRLPRSPIEPVMMVRAFVGPLSPLNAEEFRKVWKTPPRERAGYFQHILKSDPDRGAERVGRLLAREHGHPWAEFWGFLDGFVDLSSADGLRRLEEYLSRKNFTEHPHGEPGENETSNRFRTPSPGKPRKFSNSVSVGAFLDEGADISLEEMKNRQNAALTSISGGPRDVPRGVATGRMEFHILPQGSSLIEAAAERELLLEAGKNGEGGAEGERTPPRGSASLPSPITNLMVEFERMSLHDHTDGSPRERRRSGGRRHREAPAAAELAAGLGRLGMEDGGEGASTSGSSEEYFMAEEGVRTGAGSGMERSPCARSRSWDHGSSTSSGSYKSFDRSHDVIPTTPPRARKELFIEGESPSRLDREVLAAIEGVDVDPLRFPNVHRWRNTVQSFSSVERESWPTPAVLKSHCRLQSLTPGSPVSVLISPANRYSPVRHAYSPDYTSPGRYSHAHPSYSPAHSSYSPASYIQRIRLKHFGDSPI